MKRTSVGARLYMGVLAVFLVFAALFVLFQQSREKKYKADMLNTKLQDYNVRMAESLAYAGTISEEVMDKYVVKHHVPDLRVTIVDKGGRVLFDNEYKDYASLGSHADRKEIADALKNGTGMNISRMSRTMNNDCFYSATYFPKQQIIIRTALPYNNSLLRSLKSDSHYLWFAFTAMLVLVAVIYSFVNRLGVNITKLRIFAERADRNESLDTEDLVDFPGDELGEIAERIIKIYKRLERTKEEQNMLKRQLTQNVAHELKTPVASILGYLDTITENPDMDNDTKMQFFERCKVQACRLKSLLQDISLLNRMDDVSGMIKFDEADISHIVADIEKETALQVAARGMTLRNAIPGGIVVRGSHSLLYSIFRNLIDNAIAYAGQDTVMTLSSEDRGDRWLFSFSDNGCGIPEEHLPRIFERFYRVDKGRSRKLGGTGLGLAIVKNAVVMHGGTITAKNNPGGGVTFTFSIMK